MRNRLLLLMLLGLLLGLGAFLAYTWTAPRLLSVSPPDGAAAIPAGAVLHLAFSRPMNTASVTERLAIEPARQGAFTWQANTLTFTPDQPWETGSAVRVRLQAGARGAGFPSLPLRQEIAWSFQIRLPELAYLFPSNGPANIYATNPLSGVSILLTDFPGGVTDFSVSTGGTGIYFSAYNTQGGSDIYSLQVVPPQAEQSQPQPQLILACPQALCQAAVASPQGNYLAYERTALPGVDQTDRPQVWYMFLPPDGAPQGEAAPILAGDPAHQTLQPTWSPSGLLTFYDSDAKSYIFLDIPSSQTTAFPNQTGLEGAWHPNGRDYLAAEILFVDLNAADSVAGLQKYANSHLLMFDRLEGTITDLTPGEDMEDANPAFSPDGKFLAFARKYLGAQRWTPGRQLWLMYLGSREAQPMTNSPNYSHFDFAWSPSSDQLAYVRFDQTALTQPTEIWLMDALTGSAVQLIIGGYAPAWIP